MSQIDPNLDPRALAAQNTYAGALMGRLGFGPNAPLGTGMAQGAANQLQIAPAYKAYAETEMVSGRQPLPLDQWMQMQMSRQQPGRGILGTGQ